MTILVGLVDESEGWKSLLRQEGVPFTLLTSSDQLRPEDFSLVVADTPAGEWDEGIRAYVRKGGALLTSALYHGKCLGGSGKRRSIRYILPESQSAFSGIGLVDIYHKGTILQHATLCSTERGTKSVAVQHLGEGIVVALPIHVGSLYYDRRKAQKHFYSPAGNHPNERVSLVSKGAIRRLVHAALEFLHHERGIPYCHLWHFPEGSDNIFALRIDSDFGTEKDIETLRMFADDNSTKMNWYLHVRAHERWLSRFRTMHDHEVGVHCYEHAELRSATAARDDIARAKRALDENGMSASGFAAPFGEWSTDLATVLEEFGFLYSSEFTYDYDNLPSHPLVDGKVTPVLQVPVHPICIGSFNKLRISEKEMIGYFEFVIRMKQANHEPLFFYHHPRDGHHAVLQYLVDTSRAITSRNILLRDFARWWNDRAGITYSLELLGDRLRVESTASSKQFLRLSKRSHEAIVPFSADIDLSRVTWQEKIPMPPIPIDIATIRTFSFRLLSEEIKSRLRRAYK